MGSLSPQVQSWGQGRMSGRQLSQPDCLQCSPGLRVWDASHASVWPQKPGTGIPLLCLAARLPEGKEGSPLPASSGAAERGRDQGRWEDGPSALLGLQPQGCEVEPSGCAT